MRKLFILLSIIYYSLFIIPGLVFAVYSPGETFISAEGRYNLDSPVIEEDVNSNIQQSQGQAQNYTTSCGPQGNGYKLCIPILGVDFIENSLAEYIRIIYRFALGLSGLLVFIMIVWGGIQYTISAGDTGLINDARDRISQAILGMILLFLSYIILNTINPDLISLREPNVDSVVLPNIAPAWNTAEEKASRAQFLQTASKKELSNQDELDNILERLDNDPDNQELKDQALAKEFDTLSERGKQLTSREGTVNNEIRLLAEKQNNYLSWIGINGLSLNERQRLAELRERQIQLQNENRQNISRMQEIKNLRQ